MYLLSYLGLISKSYFLILIFTALFFPLPSVAMAVIFTVFPFAFLEVLTTPLELTVAPSVLLEDHLRTLLAPLAALTLAFNFSFLPALVCNGSQVFWLSDVLLPEEMPYRETLAYGC